MSPSKRKGKKYQAVLSDGSTIHFGAEGYSDYTIHKDDDRKARYLSRHKSREDWTKKGIHSAGFWARWILWNKKTIGESVRDVKKRFNL